jgi:RimJ/RimL family protein N-acetyltransferase
VPRLVGERIVLREFMKEDIEHIRKWVNDPSVVDYLSDAFLYPHTLNETERFVNEILDGKSQIRGFVIVEKDSGAYIGQLGLVNIDWKNRVGEMGIVIGNADYRGRGYGTEAIRLLQDFVFRRLNLNRLELTVYEDNAAAQRCYRKCGFNEEGRKRLNIFRNGRYRDTIFMGILKEEYERALKGA